MGKRKAEKYGGAVGGEKARGQAGMGAQGWQAFLERIFFAPIGSAWLGAFRLLWGLCLTYETCGYLSHHFAKLRSAVLTSHPVRYYALTWLPLCSLQSMQIISCVLFGLSICIALGFFSRTSTALFALLFPWLAFYEASLYLNHIYLTAVISLALACLPTGASISLDSVLFPKISRQRYISRWTLILLQGLLLIVYTHAGLAKINEDWLRGEPLRHWLPKRAHIYGPIMLQESLAYAMSYIGLVYDLVAVPLLMIPQTRTLGVLLNITFHCTNKLIFSIGIFPLIMCSALTIFFPPSQAEHAQASLERMVGTPLRVSHQKPKLKGRITVKQGIVILLLCTFLAGQALYPLRHYMYEGDVAWNEYGHLLSWRMKLRDKTCNAKRVFLRDPETGAKSNGMRALERLYSTRQRRTAWSRPDQLAQMAHTLADSFTNRTSGVRPEVHMDIVCQLNFRPLAQFTDPKQDMAGWPAFQWPYPWLMPEPKLPAHLEADYPWNFEWTFSWLTTFPECHFRDNHELLGVDRNVY